MHKIILSFFFIISSGFIFRIVKPGDIDIDYLRKSINTIVFNLFLPALCVKVMLNAPLSFETFIIPLNSLITLTSMVTISGLFFVLLRKYFHIDSKELGALIIVSTFGNTTYLGLPIITGLYGESSARYVLYYDLLANTPFLWTVGARLSAHFGGKTGPSIIDSIRKILTLPPLLGIAIGIFLNILKAPIPDFIVKALDMLGSTVVPLMIFSIGLSLSFVRSKHTLALIPVCVFKLLFSPLIGFYLGKIMGIQGNALSIVALEAGMPSMVLSLLVASIFGLDVTLTAFAIVVTTLFSFVTLPLILKILSLI